MVYLHDCQCIFDLQFFLCACSFFTCDLFEKYAHYYWLYHLTKRIIDVDPRLCTKAYTSSSFLDVKQSPSNQDISPVMINSGLKLNMSVLCVRTISYKYKLC